MMSDLEKLSHKQKGDLVQMQKNVAKEHEKRLQVEGEKVELEQQLQSRNEEASVIISFSRFVFPFDFDINFVMCFGHRHGTGEMGSSLMFIKVFRT